MAVEAVSAGAILFRDTRGRREYLLLKSRPGDWESPKGGAEGSEELQQTAIREVKEKAGIQDFRLIDSFRENYSYVFETNGTTIHKTAHPFIARSFEASAELSTEHYDLQWRDYEQAISTITQDGPREIFERVHEFLDDLAVKNEDEHKYLKQRRPNRPAPETRCQRATAPHVGAGGAGGDSRGIICIIVEPRAEATRPKRLRPPAATSGRERRHRP